MFRMDLAGQGLGLRPDENQLVLGDWLSSWMTYCVEKVVSSLVCSSDKWIFGKFLKLTMKLFIG